MLRDGRGVADGDTIDTDVCIVGAGPAGITLACTLADMDIRVCLLESGGKRLVREDQRLAAGVSEGYSYWRLGHARGRAFGGSSLLWPLDEGWRARPLDPIDFEQRPWVPHSGWPFDLAHLEPFYRRAQPICDLGPYGYRAADWPGEQAPPFPLDDERVQTTTFQLGATDFSRYYDSLLRAANVQLILHATAVDLATDERPEALDRIEVAAGGDSRFAVRARHYVLAAGGLDNARLLLVSRRTQPRGLGNQHDLVGRYFMERLSLRSGHFDAGDAAVERYAPRYLTRRVDGTWVQGSLRLSERVMREEGLLNGTFFVLPRSRAFTSEGVRSLKTLLMARRRQPFPAGSLGHLANIARDANHLASMGAAAVRERVRGRPAPDVHAPGTVFVVRPQAEQSPNPDSRVVLDDRVRDRFGLPRLRLRWRLADADLDSIRRSQDVLADELEKAGLGCLERRLGEESPPAQIEGNFHHMGTTRMHVDPRRGVVDADARVHGMTNLHVAGSSVFPTAGCSNPTLTVVALSLRLADHLRARLLAS